MIFNLFIKANIAYYLNFEYENTYHEAISIADSIDNVADNKNVKVAIIGERTKEAALDYNEKTNSAFMFTDMIEKGLLLDDVHTENFLKNVLYCDYYYVDTKTKNVLSETDKYKICIHGQIKILYR